MNGKGKCKILKDIRRQIAAANDIAYVTTDCKFQGNCSGTCPKCESEVRYLEAELEKRRSAGKAIAVAGIAAAMMVSTAACAPNQPAATPQPTQSPTSTPTNGTTAPTSAPTTPASETTEGYDGELIWQTEPSGESTVPSTEDGPGGILPLPGMIVLPSDELMGEPTNPPESVSTLPPETGPLLMGVLPPEDMSDPLIPFESVSTLPPETDPFLMGDIPLPPKDSDSDFEPAW